MSETKPLISNLSDAGSANADDEGMQGALEEFADFLIDWHRARSQDAKAKSE